MSDQNTLPEDDLSPDLPLDAEPLELDPEGAALPQERINEFVIAAHGDFDKVKAMLAETPALVDEYADWMESPLQAAAHTNQRTIAEYLLDFGAPLDICTAAMLGRMDDVRAMLAENPALYEANGAHNIPLMFFPAISGDTEIADVLLNAGAAINVGEGGNTPLHGAAGFNQPGMVRWLLDRDANPFALDFNGKRPIELAEERSFTEVVDILRPYTDLSRAE